MAKSIRVKVASNTGDPATKVGDVIIPTSKSKYDEELDIRDHLAELVGKGNALSPDDKAAIYGGLTARLGRDKATKVMNHAYLFNQRPDVLKLPLEDKIRAFYTMGSNDPDVNSLITKSKSLGYGVLPGFRQSSSSLNQELNGQVPVTATTGSINPEVQRRVIIQVRK